MTARRAAGAALASALLAAPLPARALDYLEHTFLTDRACLEAQRRLAPALPSADPETVARYLALSLACPERWEKPYCQGDYKQLEANLNRLDRPPLESFDHSVTLGDFAALADHLSAYGAVRNFPLAGTGGLVDLTWRWLGTTGDAGGVVSDVAEDACETDGRVRWPDLERDIAQSITSLEAGGGAPPRLPRRWLSPAGRGPVPRGPFDPAGAYSFDNPHYLDLVGRNRHHFAPDAYATWLGFHATATALGALPCAEVADPDDDDLEDLAEGLPRFEAVDWDALEGQGLRDEGCRLLAERVRLRLLDWARRADPALVAPVGHALALLAAPDSPPRAVLLDRIAAALAGVVFAGGGLHFLQDSMTGGHLRGSKAGLGLEDRRWDHDLDCRHGVVASWATRSGEAELVLFGDSYVVGPPAGPAGDCAPDPAAGPATVTACLVRQQRGLLVAASAAALVDFVMGGLLYEATSLPEVGCPEEETPDRFVCRFLPTRAPVAAGLPAGPAPARLAHGTLPVPPPPWSYQSLLVSTAVDGTGGGLQMGLRAEFLSQLGARANWMTSWQVGLLSSPGTGSGASVTTELSYVFHWRWAARFLVNAGPFLHGGLRGFGETVSAFTGVGPSVGLSLLPEGWTKSPLEFTLTYRLPITLLDSRYGFVAEGIRVEAHWLEFALGLAFM